MACNLDYTEFYNSIPKWAIVAENLWGSRLEKTWQENNSETYNMAVQALVTSAKKGNSYWLALTLAANTKDWPRDRSSRGMKPTLAKVILEAALATLVEPTFRGPSPNISQCAFGLLFQNANNEVFDLANRLFCFSNVRMACVRIIRQSLQANAFPIENTARAVLALNLQGWFSVREFMFPLFAQSNTKLLYNLIANDAVKQKEFVRFLDGLLADKVDSDLDEALERFREHKIGRVALSRANLKKTVLRLAKKHKLPSECYPNAARWQLSSTLAYLLHEIYVKGNIPKDDGLDAVRELVGGDRMMQQQALAYLVSPKSNDVTTATFLARSWGLRMPAFSVAPLAAKGGEKNVEPVTYYQLKLPNAAVTFVDSKEKFEVFMMDAMETYGSEYKQIGIDCEWRPVYQPNKTPRLALLQVATQCSAHLFDMIALKEILQQDDWGAFVEVVFLDNCVCKLGFSLGGDLSMLHNFHPEFKAIKCENFLDLRTKCMNLLHKKPHLFPYFHPNIPNSRGLSDFVRLCFGFPLDKRQQKSDWERRPLRTAQITYAALDAFCLVEIQSFIEYKCQMQGI